MDDIKDLKDYIFETIDKEIANKKILQEIKDEFLRKGLNPRIPDLIWQDKVDWDKLSNHELMAIASSIRYELGEQDKDNKDDSEITFADLDNDKFSLSRYFTKGEIKEYNNLNKIKEDIYDSVELKDVVKIDENNYHCIISAEQLALYRKNQLITYNPKFQRASKIVTTKNGISRRAANLNKKGVTELTNRFLKKDIAPTSITLCVAYDNEKALDENFKFIPTHTENIGNLFIRPDIREELPPEDSLELNIPDGFHRYNALTNAFEESERDGKYLDYKLGCFIHIMKEDEEIRYVRDVFKRNETSAEYLKALEGTDENKFVDQFEQNCMWLRDHISTTNKELKLRDKYVTKKTLVDAFKKTDIAMDRTITSSNIGREKVAKITDQILDYVKQELFANDIEKMRESIFLNDKMFEIYIRFAARIRNEKSYFLNIANLIDYLSENEALIKEKINIRFEMMKIIEEAIEYGI